MENKYIAFLIVSLIAITSVAQTKIERSVLSSGGNDAATSTIHLTSTIGESIVTTENSTGILLTQGFQQSIVVDSIILYFRTFKASCIGRSNGRMVIDSIKGCEGPYQKLWVAGIVSADSNSVSGLAAGNYSVQIVSANSCDNIFSYTIENELDGPCLLKFFSGITPNNDGLNDKWMIENIEIFPTNEINIFNRLGNKVFEGKNYNNNDVVWKGNNLSGGDLPSDTYFYVFEAEGETEKGWIELTR